jgi:hypothetical protein
MILFTTHPKMKQKREKLFYIKIYLLFLTKIIGKSILQYVFGSTRKNYFY